MKKSITKSVQRSLCSDVRVGLGMILMYIWLKSTIDIRLYYSNEINFVLGIHNAIYQITIFFPSFYHQVSFGIWSRKYCTRRHRPQIFERLYMFKYIGLKSRSLLLPRIYTYLNFLITKAILHFTLFLK